MWHCQSCESCNHLIIYCRCCSRQGSTVTTNFPLFNSLCPILLWAAQLGLELPEPQQGRLLDLVPSADGTRAVAALQVGFSLAFGCL